MVPRLQPHAQISGFDLGPASTHLPQDVRRARARHALWHWGIGLSAALTGMGVLAALVVGVMRAPKALAVEDAPRRSATIARHAPRGVIATPTIEAQAAAAVQADCEPEPKLERAAPVSLASADVAKLLRDDPEQLGSASIGGPTRGSLFGGVQLRASEGITPAGDHGWGTRTVVASIERAVREVRRCYDGTPKLSVGDISRQGGGFLSPHRSHQSGLDADIGYYYREGPGWFLPATADTLDVPRTWALVRSLIEGGNVEYVFMDRSVQRLLRDYMQSLGDKERMPLEGLFEIDDKKNAIVRHVHGHATHFHVRFFDEDATALGAKLAQYGPRIARATPRKPVPRAAAPRKLPAARPVHRKPLPKKR
ncbi:MAG: hypothetical protein HOW73_33765 [Polyangiaceae bacterium]|nr:hypothetical protein [Polyangiaceae bacterium]